MGRMRGALLAGCRHHADAQTAGAVVLEANHAVHEREQRVVLGQADVLPRLPLRAVLPQDDGAATHGLAPEALHAQPLGIAVPAVAARSLSFLVRHVSRTSQKASSGTGLLRAGWPLFDTDSAWIRARCCRSSVRCSPGGVPGCVD